MRKFGEVCKSKGGTPILLLNTSGEVSVGCSGIGIDALSDLQAAITREEYTAKNKSALRKISSLALSVAPLPLRVGGAILL